MQKNKVIKLVSLIIGVFLAGFSFAQAGIFDWAEDAIINILVLVIGWINYLIGFIGSIIIQIGSFLINWGLTLNQQILQSPTVKIGFGITLDLANLGFVLVIIVIAFATILRIESYAMKQTLRKLILAALLVNFSLTIAGLFIDFTNVLSNFFVKGIDIENIGTSLSAAMRPQKWLDLNETEEGLNNVNEKSALTKILTILASLFFAVFFTILTGIALIGTAVMIFIRYIWLTILLILMPLAWLFWVLPLYSEKAGDWWNKFLKWNFFLPAALFFIYLAISVLNPPPKLIKENVIENITSNLAQNSSQEIKTITGTEDFLGKIGRMLAVLGILTGGLMAAESMGIAGAGAALKAAGAVKGWATGQVGKIAKVAAKGAAAPAAATGGLLSQKITGSNAWKGVANWMSTKPGLRNVAAGMYNLTAAPQKDVEAIQKEMAGSSDEAIIAKAGGFIIDPREKAAYANELVKRGLEEKFIEQKGGQQKFNDLLEATKNTGTTKGILSKRADLAPQLGESIQEAVGKLSPDDIIQQSEKSLANPDVIQALDPRSITNLIKKASSKKLKHLAVALGQIRNQNVNAVQVLTAISNPIMQRIIKEMVKTKKDVEKGIEEDIEEDIEKIEEIKKKFNVDISGLVADVKTEIRSAEVAARAKKA